MRYIDEFRDSGLVHKLSRNIQEIMPARPVNVMEVCGSHTQSFYRFGIDKLLPKNLRLVSGPGCPVCVSPQEYLDAAIELAKDKRNIIVSFGDMLRVPGTSSTLEKERADGANVVMVYSALEAIKVAQCNPQNKIIFLAVGFETTAGTIALSIKTAKKEKIINLSFLVFLKLIPPAMGHLLTDRRLNIDAFLCPGHVSSIIGTKPYEFIPRNYHKAGCVAGFEPVDILEGLYLLLRQIVDNKPRVENQYIRAVTRAGNLSAQKIIREIFQISNSSWRGLGKIPKSGLKIRSGYSEFDAQKKFLIRTNRGAPSLKRKGCLCAEVLKGLARPDECPLFKKTCTPQNAFGPCMISSEGACNVYYKYR